MCISTKKRSVKAFLRIRPYIFNETQQTQWKFDEKQIMEQDNSIDTKYEFTEIFNQQSNNDDIYKAAIHPLLRKFIKGYNGCIFCYGQTASGKTHTIFGHQSLQTKGIIYQALDYIFNKKQKYQNNMVVYISFMEIYNESVSDLLEDTYIQNNLKVNEIQGNFVVQNLKEVLVNNQKECIQLLLLGNQNKTMGDSYLHDKSSRSHTIFKIILGKQSSKTGQRFISEVLFDIQFQLQQLVVGKKEQNKLQLNFVDLAGSELISDQFGQQQQSETKAINLSLFCLKGVINALSQNEKFIPYRNSVLTKLLANSLGGNSLTSVICTISPCLEHHGNSKRTIQFGQIARKIKNILRINYLYQNFGNKNEQIKYKENVELEEVKINENKLKMNTFKNQDQIINQSQNQIIYLKSNPKQKVNVNVIGDPSNPLAILSHAYGHDCDGKSCLYYLWDFLVEKNYFVIAPDYPGFGLSEGERFSSRQENYQQINQFIYDLILYYNQSQKKVLLIGYDWGAGLSLRFACENSQFIQKIIAFHPSWTQDMSPLMSIQTQVILLWVNVEQLHPITQGEKMNKIIPKCKLLKVNCGKYTSDKPKGYYSCLSDLIREKLKDEIPIQQDIIKIKQKQVQQFQQQQQQQQQQNISKENDNENNSSQSLSSEDEEYKIEQENQYQYTLNLEQMIQQRNFPDNQFYQQYRGACIRGEFQSQQQQQASNYQYSIPIEPEMHYSKKQMKIWAVLRFTELYKSGEIQDYYKAYLANNSLRPQAVRLFMSLPKLLPYTDPQKFIDYCIWPSLPKNIDTINNFPQYLKNRQVHTKLKSNASILNGEDEFLTFNRNSNDIVVTHKAYIIGEKNNDFIIKVKKNKNEFEIVEVKKNDIYQLNEASNFSGNPLVEGLLFEDGVRCKYGDALTKAKIMEAAISIQDLVQQIDYAQFRKLDIVKNEQNQDIQVNNFYDEQQQNLIEQCTYRIAYLIDIIHLVHEGIDNQRYCSNDCGKLAYYGQGNCHTLASVLCAMLLPFAKVLGINIKFRAGSIIKVGRDIQDEISFQPSNDWNGKHRNVSDHTWVEVTYYPSLLTRVIDLSFNYMNIPMDIIYSIKGKFHISDKNQCNSNNYKTPQNIFIPNNEVFINTNINQEMIQQELEKQKSYKLSFSKKGQLNWKKIIKETHIDVSKIENDNQQQ